LSSSLHDPEAKVVASLNFAEFAMSRRASLTILPMGETGGMWEIAT
jgi:hypothetical protein